MTGTIGPEVSMTLDEAVKEVLTILTGQELTYDSQLDRYRTITRHLNRALRENALELDWSYYSEVLRLGCVKEGSQVFEITTDYRFRVGNDDAVRLVTDVGIPVGWAYFLPRDALHKYANRDGLWCSVTRKQVTFSRPFLSGEEGLMLEMPVMREPRMFRLPDAPYPVTEVTNPAVPGEVDYVVEEPETLSQLVDFDLPDLITARAAFLYAQTDPVMQPRVPTLEDGYKGLMYQAIERDTAYTDSPYLNEFIVPVRGSIYPESEARPWPVSNRSQTRFPGRWV